MIRGVVGIPGDTLPGEDQSRFVLFQRSPLPHAPLANARPPYTALPRAGRLWKRHPIGACRRIGLFGGSFDPIHRGHLHVAATALQRLQLSEIWFLVAAQNPLKPQSGAFAARLAAVREFIASHGRRFRAIAAEPETGLFFSVDVVAALKRQFPRVRFVFIMGADSFAGLHRWRRWEGLVAQIPVAVIARPGPSVGIHAPVTKSGLRPMLKALTARTASRLQSRRLQPSSAAALADHASPAWIYLPARLFPDTSTRLRAAREANEAR